MCRLCRRLLPKKTQATAPRQQALEGPWTEPSCNSNDLPLGLAATRLAGSSPHENRGREADVPTSAAGRTRMTAGPHRFCIETHLRADALGSRLRLAGGDFLPFLKAPCPFSPPAPTDIYPKPRPPAIPQPGNPDSGGRKHAGVRTHSHAGVVTRGLAGAGTVHGVLGEISQWGPLVGCWAPHELDGDSWKVGGAPGREALSPAALTCMSRGR